MTIDERLDRLTERHEALSQSVELLTEDVRTLSRSVVLLTEDVQALSRSVGTPVSETRNRFAETLSFINRLAHVAEAHERRLDDLEEK